jgi:signal transduction histidine kinase
VPKPTGHSEPLYFRPAARLQYLLSEELVSDPNVAVLEFVKNAYDADATEVQVDFQFGSDLADGRIVISDNGSGMSRTDFDQNWMHPGFSEKSEQMHTSRSRIPVGEKGLGRLAAGRLGATLDVYTRRSARSPWFHAFFRWADFNKKKKLLDEIPISWDTEAPADPGYAAGTILVISDLTVKWDRRPPGRRARGQATSRLGRLRQDFEVLLMPLGAGDQEFKIFLENNSGLEEDEEVEAEVKPPLLKLLDYRYSFQVRRGRGNHWRVERAVKRSPSVAEQTGENRTTATTIPAEDLGEELDLSACGPFEATFYYAPQSAKQFRSLRIPTGVRIYRDDVRVDPYGDPGDDWLGANERKAVRQGHAAIQPNALYGAIQITKAGNPQLKPLANREGMIGNAALDTFLALCRLEFEAFGNLIEQEYLVPKWQEQQANKRSVEAFNSRQWAVVMTRATAHAVRQPVTSAGAELSRLRRAIDDSEGVPGTVRANLRGLHDETRSHLARIDEALDKMLGFLELDPEPRMVDLVQLIDEALESAEPHARSADVALFDESGKGPVRVEAPAGLLEHALDEIIGNAIRASRPKGRSAWVKVRIAKGDPLRISVTDNGSGIPADVESKLFRQSVSRTGHVGVGLLINQQLMHIARSDIKLTKTGAKGTQFDLILPS